MFWEDQEADALMIQKREAKPNWPKLDGAYMEDGVPNCKAIPNLVGANRRCRHRADFRVQYEDDNNAAIAHL
jgi:hypothetical protein